MAVNDSNADQVAPPSDDDHAALRTFLPPNVRSHCDGIEPKPGLGRRQPQLAPPAPDAGRGVAERRRDRRAEVRRLPPSRAHSTNAAPHRKERSGNPTEPGTNPNATDYTLEVRLWDCSVAIPAGLDRNGRPHDVRAIARSETFLADPGRATGGRGQTRPPEPQAERSRAQRSGPDLPWPFRAHPAVEGTGSRRDAATRSPARPCSRCRPEPVFRARLPVVIQYPPLQPVLPTGFDSWAQVLTDWRVSRAFEASPLPRCFNTEPELAAPFVSAISRAINERQLRHLPPELMLLRQRLIEPTYDRAGGPSYLALRDAMEAAQARYFTEHHPCASVHSATLPSDVRDLQTAFSATRQRYAAEVERAEHAAARAYWKAHPRHGIPDDFFDEAADDSIPARMARIDSAWWWRSFFTRLQARGKRYHAAEGRLLDALPSLRAQAKKTTLAAQIARWSEVAAADWGWRGGTHYRRLAEYAERKAQATVAWFEQRAPGYLGTQTIRRSLDTRLQTFLAERDPHFRILAAERNGLSEHWRN